VRARFGARETHGSKPGLRSNRFAWRSTGGDNPRMANGGQAKMVFLGFGKFARSDKIYALEPLRGQDRGSGQRTRVWIEGVAEPVIASRTERSILLEMGQRDALSTPILEEAVKLAQRVSNDADRVGPLLRRSIKAEAGVDFDDLGRRARRLLESTAGPGEAERLFEAE
jgi:hypothetical protein